MKEALTSFIDLPKDYELLSFVGEFDELQNDQTKASKTVFSNQRMDTLLGKNGENITDINEQAICLEGEIVKYQLLSNLTLDTEAREALVPLTDLVNNSGMGLSVFTAVYPFASGFQIRATGVIDKSENGRPELKEFMITTGWAPMTKISQAA